MSHVVLDDHLLRDLLADDVGPNLDRLLAAHSAATTNLYLVRLSRSLVSATGGALTGAWPLKARRSLARRLVRLSDDIEIVPMRSLAFRMAELADAYRLSSLGAEAVAAAEHLGAPLCVWSGDDGPRIRAAMAGIGADYRLLDV
ncbi:hypothetical protein [Candidatus Poriferisodalis sp.]|uniref:hypothetical protein n=1 Tax=Candidatus Poriferisodalis sp. TaxID=3101277 RepID=UPI003B5A712D